MAEYKFSKYERARILGARALQIAMNAPILVKMSKEELEKIRFDPIKIAETELDSGVLPISVKRPLPEKKEERLISSRGARIDDRKVMQKEVEEEEDISKEGEIMELANPEDEIEEEVSNGEEEI